SRQSRRFGGRFRPTSLGHVATLARGPLRHGTIKHGDPVANTAGTLRSDGSLGAGTSGNWAPVHCPGSTRLDAHEGLHLAGAVASPTFAESGPLASRHAPHAWV